MARQTPIDMRGRRPIIRIGQSNTKWPKPIADFPTRLRFAQDPIRAHYCDTLNGQSANNPTWHRVAPWGTGDAWGDWGMDLADGLLGNGENPALIEYCVGNTPLSYWTPGLQETAYPTISAWLLARYQELVAPLPPVLVLHQSESGAGYGGTWAENMVVAAAAYRSLFSAPNMGIIIVQNAPTSAMGVAFIPYQQAYVASDSRSRMAYVLNPTYDNGASPNNVHYDAAAGRRLAIGPDGSNVKSVLSCILELI